MTVNDDTSATEIVLVACLDPGNGGIIWKNCAAIDSSSDGDGDAQRQRDIIISDDTAAASSAATINSSADTYREDPGIVRHLRTKRWALPMLNDHRRNQMYEHAIRRACAEMSHRRAMEHDVRNNNAGSTNNETTIRILDIGSGTGLLAMMGAKYVEDAQQQFVAEQSVHKQTVQVTTVEMASAMARLARITIEENNLSDKITVVEHHSTDSTFQLDDTRFRAKGHDSLPHSNNDEETSTAKRIKVGGDEHHNEKADICTSELLESGLLGEGVLPSIRDAWERHLKPDAIVIPRRARVYAVLIEGLPINAATSAEEEENKNKDTTINAATAFLGPDLHEFYKASGGVWLSTTASSSASASLGTNTGGETLLGSAHDGVTISLHANAMLQSNYRDNSGNDISGTRFGEHRGIRPLTAPVEVLDFTFSDGYDALPPAAGRCTVTDVTPIVDGTCHGVIFWWELDLWDDDDSTYSTIPIGYFDTDGDKSIKDIWQDHWQQCLFVFGDSHSPEHRDELRKLRVGHTVQIVTSHNDSTISFSIRGKQGVTDTESSPIGSQNGTVCSLSNQHISTTRALQLNDTSRIDILRNAIQYCIDANGRDAPLLDISDMGICAMIASALGSRKVTSLESSSGALPTVAATIAQIGNGYPLPEAEFQIIQAQAEYILTEHILGGAAEIVVAEPYYEILEGWHLQEALNYFYTMRSLKRRGIISSTAISVPTYANVMACVVECEQFSSAYGQVGDSTFHKVAGFNHSAVNYYGNRYHTYDVSLPLWQYRYKPLSQPFCVATIPYEGASQTIETKGGKSIFTSTGFAQAVVFWVDYYCRTKADVEVITTSSSSHRQLVRKLDMSIVVSEDDIKAGLKFCCRASFDIGSPDGIEDHSFSFDIKPSTATERHC